MELVLAAVVASNEYVTWIGQALTRNEPYNGGLASTLPQQLPIVQPQGVAPPTATYQVVQPLGVVQPQVAPYQTGARPMGQNIGHQTENYWGTPLVTPRGRYSDLGSLTDPQSVRKLP